MPPLDETPAPSTPVAAPTPPASGRLATLAWMTFACLLLVSSGVARSWQDRRHRVEADYIESCPFPLKSIPTTLGAWKLVGGGERSLDKLTMRITGGTDYILRNYVDEMTGVSLVVLVLFGPAEPVIPHTPEVCYPASGFALADEVSDRVIQAEGGTSGRFRSAVYARSGGPSTLPEEGYHSFRLEGRWSPDVGSGRKFPRRNPSVFKVQVQRRVAEGERRDRDDPIEQFLSHLVGAIERGIASAEKSGPTSAGGVGPSAMRGGPVDGRILPDPGDPGPAEEGPVGQAMGRLARGPGHAPGEHRDAADQADEDQDRRQVDDHRHPDREADRVARAARDATRVD